MQLQAYKGYFENGNFYTAGKSIHIPERRQVILTILEEYPTQDIDTLENHEEDMEKIRQKRLAFMGCMDGKVWMADDFDEPLEEMKEYME